MPPTSTHRTVLASADRTGMFGSLLCAIHCALLPLVIAGLPALGLGAMPWVDIDQAFTVFATLLGITTLTLGWRRHREVHAWVVLMPGVAMMWLGSFTGLHSHSFGHTVVMVAGGLAVAAAHLVNLRLTHQAARMVGYAPSQSA